MRKPAFLVELPKPESCFLKQTFFFSDHWSLNSVRTSLSTCTSNRICGDNDPNCLRKRSHRQSCRGHSPYIWVEYRSGQYTTISTLAYFVFFATSYIYNFCSAHLLVMQLSIFIELSMLRPILDLKLSQLHQLIS